MAALLIGIYYGLALAYLFFSLCVIKFFFNNVKEDDKISEMILLGYPKNLKLKEFHEIIEKKQIERNNSYEKDSRTIEALALEKYFKKIT